MRVSLAIFAALQKKKRKASGVSARSAHITVIVAASSVSRSTQSEKQTKLYSLQGYYPSLMEKIRVFVVLMFFITLPGGSKIDREYSRI